MSTEEFSTQFDVLYNNVTSNQAPGLNEYEKSVFLTKAQSQMVLEYFNRRTDNIGGGFDGSERRQYDFSSIIRTENLFNVNTCKTRITDLEKLDRRSIVYLFPYNYYLAVNEIISDTRYQYSVMPIDYSEYQRLMLKPYNFPVKRGAWRLLTDKKNCNFVHEDAEGNSLAYDEVASADYRILSSWADQKRNLKINIQTPSTWSSADEVEHVTVTGDTIKFKASDNSCYAKIVADCGWNSSATKYSVALTVYSSHADDIDDEIAINLLRDGFTQAKENSATWITSDTEAAKAATHTDCFMMAEAPSKYNTFSSETGRTFNMSVIQVPTAEVIGKFVGEPTYQMRFVRTLTPIILDDLTNYGNGISIDGIQKATECMLPEECHQEILERAVTLAKIAWAGATATQAAGQQGN